MSYCEFSTPTEYVDHLHTMTLSSDYITTPTTIDECCAQYAITGGMDNFYFNNHDYSRAVWSLMCDAGAGVAPSIGDIDTIRFYFKNGAGWFDPATAEDYGSAFFAKTGGVDDVIARLNGDIYSRQAVIRLQGDSCLTNVQVRFVNSHLITVANFRSLDLMRGLPTDAWILQRLTSHIANALRHPITSKVLIIQAVSAHIYSKDINTIHQAYEELQTIEQF